MQISTCVTSVEPPFEKMSEDSAPPESLRSDAARSVRAALAEDLGGEGKGTEADITALLVPEGAIASATVITREPGVFCGSLWAEETFRALDPEVRLVWHVKDGEEVKENQLLLDLSGRARSLLSGERTALNFLQTLCGTATQTRLMRSALPPGCNTRLLDTRKTLPGLRSAQKWAVKCGGGENHRTGLFDAFLVKENHLAAIEGGIAGAVRRAREIAPGNKVEIEVESHSQLEEAVAAGADVVMLDNFNIAEMKKAVEWNKKTGKRTLLEASGNVSGAEELAAVAETGVDFVSCGALTKHVKAMDLSMRFKLE